MTELIEYVIVVLLSIIGGTLGGALTTTVLKDKTLSLRAIFFKKPSSEKKRYIVFEIATTESIEANEVAKAMESAAKKLLGDLGVTKARFKLIEYDPSLRRGVLRVRKEYKWHALAVLSLIRAIGGKKVFVMPLATSGSLWKARKRAGLVKKI
ncbi:MAG: Rpp14/Pop5 family protein [Acidilobaceae archaeon]